MENLLLRSEYIEKKLSEAKYEPALGIRLSRLATMTVSEKELTLIVVRLDPGKQLVPHLHEIDGEMCVPLTKGVLTLGNPEKDSKGVYKKDNEGRIIVNWEKGQNLIPGEPIQIPPAVAHHLLAPNDQSVTVFFYLPTTHLGEDRKFVIYPRI